MGKKKTVHMAIMSILFPRVAADDAIGGCALKRGRKEIPKLEGLLRLNMSYERR